jgi:hypothetical protein
MDLVTALATDLEQLTAVLDQAPRRRVDLSRALRSLDHLSVTAISSFLGVSITLQVDGQDVTLTSVAPSVLPADLRSSLRMPLAAVAPGLAGTVVFHAGRDGALDDLAAELRATLADGGAGIRPERPAPTDLSPGVLVSGISGARELSAVNRAVGVLIGRGRTVEEARAELTELAAQAQVPLAEMADRLVQRPAG